MPAKNLFRSDEEGIYLHVYNKGVANSNIFNDEEDYKIFLGFLNDYLTPPKDPKTIKKVFTVHGRSFKGTPHQPKNYFNKVELITYSLMPDHFHMVLHQKSKGSLENFLRSLCTRYSMFVNKKYQRNGTLFEGPYRSIQVKDQIPLLYLSRYLHHHGSYSSYPEYIGLGKASWVNPEAVISFFSKGAEGDKNKALASSAYKDFVENENHGQKESSIIAGIAFDNTIYLTENEPIGVVLADRPIYQTVTGLEINLNPFQRVPELMVTIIAFLMLLTLGIGNIKVSANKNSNPAITVNPNPTTAPAVLSETTQSEEKKPEDIKSKILTVSINDGAASVNIRQKPTTDSQKLGKAQDGDTFEFVSEEPGWYGVKLEDGTTGFISSAYITTGN